MDKKTLKWCFVSLCSNNSKKTPEKMFFPVPQDKNRKKVWFDIMDEPYRDVKYYLHCCEDHFNLEEDVDNYMQYKIMGQRMKLKRTAVPHMTPSVKKGKYEQQPSTS